MFSPARSVRWWSVVAACLLACLCLSSASAQEPVPLEGRIEGNDYVSPTGLFRMTLPVLPELNGQVFDTATTVTFKDIFRTHVTVSAFPMDATLRWEESTRGRREFLIWFFTQFVAQEYGQTFPGTRVQEGARFLRAVQDGALLASVLLPGGSAFADRGAIDLQMAATIAAKRGNLLFLHGEHIFVISAELAERSMAPLTWDRTTEQEDALLRERLLALLGRITFTPRP